MNAPPPPPIQNYSLYGESELLADVLHCETIAQRSVLHDWELAPHRHDHLHQLVLLRSGGGSTRLEGRELALPPMSLVNVAPGDVHAFTFEPGTLGLVVTLTDTLPASTTFVSATPGSPTCTHAAGVVTCNLGALAAAGNT